MDETREPVENEIVIERAETRHTTHVESVNQTVSECSLSESPPPPRGPDSRLISATSLCVRLHVRFTAR